MGLCLLLMIERGLRFSESMKMAVGNGNFRSAEKKAMPGQSSNPSLSSSFRKTHVCSIILCIYMQWNNLTTFAAHNRGFISKPVFSCTYDMSVHVLSRVYKGKEIKWLLFMLKNDLVFLDSI